MPTQVKQKHMNVWMLIHAPGSVFFPAKPVGITVRLQNPGCVGQFSKHTRCLVQKPACSSFPTAFVCVSVCLCARVYVLKNYQEHYSSETQRWNRHTNQTRFPISSICTDNKLHIHTLLRNKHHMHNEWGKKLKQITTTNEQQTNSE